MNIKTNKIMDNIAKITEINNEINELLDRVKKLRQDKLNLEQENLNKHLNIGDYVKILSDGCSYDRYMLITDINKPGNALNIIGPSFSYYSDDTCRDNNYITVDCHTSEYIDQKDLEDGIITVISKEEFESTYNEMFKKVYKSLFNK